MNGVKGNMSVEFAIKVLNGTKVANEKPIKYGYQNQKFYDVARSMAVQALKEQESQNKLISDLKLEIKKLKEM